MKYFILYFCACTNANKEFQTKTGLYSTVNVWTVGHMIQGLVKHINHRLIKQY